MAWQADQVGRFEPEVAAAPTVTVRAVFGGDLAVDEVEAVDFPDSLAEDDREEQESTEDALVDWKETDMTGTAESCSGGYSELSAAAGPDIGAAAQRDL